MRDLFKMLMRFWVIMLNTMFFIKLSFPIQDMCNVDELDIM